MLLQLCYDLGFVLGAESGSTQDSRELGIFAVYIVQGADGLCDTVERGVLDGCGVLFLIPVSHVLVTDTFKQRLLSPSRESSI